MKRESPLTRQKGLSRKSQLGKSSSEVPPSPGDGAGPPLKSSGGLSRGRGFSASKRQQEKVRHLPCLVCDVEPFQAKIDPAHLCPRSFGGCDSRFCVVPLCRVCHNAFDGGRLDILRDLVGSRFGLEVVHALIHYRLDLVALLNRLTGQRWTAPATESF